MESPATTTAATNGTDFSLRSSGKTYLDQKGETDRIAERIATSSASVIGIAGVRGAGKSSLAKKVLDKCNSSGFFTLLIPSPTGYEPREFLLAIFQRIAEHASERIQAITQGADDLASLGRRQLVRMRWRLLLASAGLLLVILGALAAVYVQTTLWTMQDAAARDAATRGRDIDRAISAIQDFQQLAQWITSPSTRLADAISSDPRVDRIIPMLDRLSDEQLERLKTDLETGLVTLQNAQKERQDHITLGLSKIKEVQSRRSKAGAAATEHAPPANFAQYTAATKIAATGELPSELEDLSDQQLSDLLKALNYQSNEDRERTKRVSDALSQIERIKAQRLQGRAADRKPSEDELVAAISEDPSILDNSTSLLNALSDDELGRLAARLRKVEQSIQPGSVTVSTVIDSQITHFSALAAIGIAVFVVIMAVILYMWKLTLKYRVLHRHKAELGLQSRCQEFIELVKYQSTIGTSSELSVAPKYFTGKITRSKQLADRPLSLPGLTATCSEFLQEVAEVFSGKVVICIDELDKITEIAQLFELLKGIKGILGQDNTHFILTVSEDAMAFFNERLSRERSLIESSFEEIVYLDRLSCGLARNVICQSLGMMYVEQEPFLRNSLMLWLFAAGIPREIKRHLFTCYANGVDIRTDSPIEVWRLLYLAMLNSMLSTTAPKEVAGLDEQYKFLICIESIIGLAGSTSEATAPGEFIGEVTNILASYFGQSFHRLLGPRLMDQARTQKDDETAITSYFGQLVETLIGALLFAIAGPDGQRTVNRSNLDSMIYVYKYVPINAQFAFYGLNNFLRTRLREFGVDLKELLLSPRAAIAAETADNRSPSADTSAHRAGAGADGPGELRVVG